MAAPASAPCKPGWIVPISIIAISMALRFLPGQIAPLTLVHFMSMGFGPLLGLLGLFGWWLFARGTSWRDRGIGVGAAVAVLALVALTSHPTMGQFLFMVAVPLALGIVGTGLLLTRGQEWPRRRLLLAVGLAFGLLPWGLFRSDGQGGSLEPSLAWRWSPTAEQRFLAERGDGSAVVRSAATRTHDDARWTSDWPGFRGPTRDGLARDIRFDTDWTTSPLDELWRQRLGPGWSSFAVAGNLVVTQEQRGDEETIVAYALADGREIWAHPVQERFEEPQAGPGPRATPTFAGDAVYAMTASGSVVAVDLRSGRRRWSRNVVEDTGAKIPMWGFAASPLVLDDTVITFAGAAGQALVGYAAADGELRWSGGQGTESYSSPQPFSIDGQQHAVIATDRGLEAFDPAGGEPRWTHDWSILQTPRNTVPLALDAPGELVLPTGYGEGTQRIRVEAQGDGYATTTLWQSRYLKPYFNDAVCFNGHCYGFDGRIFTCISLEDGERRWKGGRYGHGQAVGLPAMDAVLVIAESGDLVLVAADPTELRELARVDEALHGKTWNHPVITQGKLLLRNAEEMVAYELPGYSGPAAAVESAPAAE